MTDEQKQAIKNLRSQGQSALQIAASLGLSVNTVKSFCRRERQKADFCKQCGQPLLHFYGHRRKTFCTDNCRYIWWNAHRHLMNHEVIYRHTCLYCGEDFKSPRNDRKYCSRSCYIAARYGVP